MICNSDRWKAALETAEEEDERIMLANDKLLWKFVCRNISVEYV